MTSESRSIPVEDIVLHERCQARAEIRHEAIAEYAEAIAAKVDLPPLRVARVSGVLYLIDGFHRLAGYRQAGASFVRVEIADAATLDHAEWLAVAANQGHGLRRSNADKRKAVNMALRSPIGSEQSSRIIADHLGVSPNFVAEVRAEHEAALRRAGDVSSDDTSTEKRKDSKGRMQPATKPRRERAPDPAPEPEALPLPDPATTAQPMPPGGAELLRSADILRAARMEIRRVLPSDIRERYDAPIKSAETAMRLAVPVVCDACGGSGSSCRMCQRKGWILTSQLGKVPRA